MTDQDIAAIIIRLRRKVEILRLDTKARGGAAHDLSEMLTLIDMLERKLQ